ncbi:MAG TPA: hypothetical protein VMQ81_03865, partial [Acidimicrobiia bacterium]|nr:hypothetical protein [Acidimicrobiia bacterium]
MKARPGTVAVVATTALLAGAAGVAVASPPAPLGGLQPGVRYLAAEDDRQRVEFFVAAERPDGGARLAMRVDV